MRQIQPHGPTADPKEDRRQSAPSVRCWLSRHAPGSQRCFSDRPKFIEYLLALTDGVTGRIIDLLRRAAIDALTQKSKSVGIDHLLLAGAHLPSSTNAPNLRFRT